MGLEIFFQYLFEFIFLFKFWRVIPVNKIGVRIRFGKNAVEMQPGFHFIWPFEIDHVDAFIVTPEWVSTHTVHITTKDFKTVSAAPAIKYQIIDAIAWKYAENDAATNLHDVTRLCTSDILTEENWEDYMKRPTWTKIKNKIKDKTSGLGIEIQDFGLVDLTLCRVIITQI